MMKSYLGSSFISKNVVNDECGLSALEEPKLSFAQGYISACGDALHVGYVNVLQQQIKAVSGFGSEYLLFNELVRYFLEAFNTVAYRLAWA